MTAGNTTRNFSRYEIFQLCFVRSFILYSLLYLLLASLSVFFFTHLSLSLNTPYHRHYASSSFFHPLRFLTDFVKGLENFAVKISVNKQDLQGPPEPVCAVTIVVTILEMLILIKRL
jgi:hypothetical protein